MSLEDDLERLRRKGINLEPDLGPTPHHRRIVAVSPDPQHPNRCYCILECLHIVYVFGDIRHSGGIVSCDQCKQAAENKS